jgi:hypothetical protein
MGLDCGAEKIVKKIRFFVPYPVDIAPPILFIGSLCGAQSASPFDGQHLLDLQPQISAGFGRFEVFVVSGPSFFFGEELAGIHRRLLFDN